MSIVPTQSSYSTKINLTEKNIISMDGRVVARPYRDSEGQALRSCAFCIVVLVALSGAFFVLPLIPALAVGATVVLGGALLSSCCSARPYSGYSTTTYVPSQRWSWAPMIVPSWQSPGPRAGVGISGFTPAQRPVAPTSYPRAALGTSGYFSASGPRVRVGGAGTYPAYGHPGTSGGHGAPGGARVPVGTYG